MDGLAFLGLFCAGLMLILPVVGLFLALSARGRVQKLEGRVTELEDELRLLKWRPAVEPERKPDLAARVAPPRAPAPPPVEPAPAPVPPTVAPVAVEAVEPSAPPPASAPPASAPPASAPPASPPLRPPVEAPPAAPIRFERVAIWMLAGLAGLGLLVAAFLFYDLAVQRGIITPGVRYALGLLVGVGIIVGGEVLWRRDYRVPAAALSGAGVGVLYTALYAGATRYGLVGVLPTFALMAGVTGVSTLLAVQHRSLFLALLGALGGFGTPVMLSTGQNRAVALFAYLLLLNSGLMVASVRRRWPALVLSAGLATLAIQLGWALKFHDPASAPVGLVAPLVLGGLFWAVALRSRTDEHTAMAAAASALGVLLALMPFLTPIEGGVDGAGLHGLTYALGGVGALVVATAALYGLARSRGWAPLAVVVSLLSALPTLGFAGLWSAGDHPEPWAVALLLLAMPALAIGVPGRGPSALLGLAGAALASLVSVSALRLGAEGLLPWPPVLVVACGLSALGLGLSRTEGGRFAPLLTLGQAAIALAVLGGPLGEHHADGVTLAAGGGLVLVYLASPFVLGQADDRRPLGPWLASALAGPALFLPLYDAWDRAWGDVALGLLPALLGLLSLGALGGLVRTRTRDASDRDLAMYTAVALLFLAAAIPIQLSDEWITLGWALEVAALAWVRGRLTHRMLTPFALVLAAMVAVRLLLNEDALDYHPVAGPVVFNWITYTWGVPALCFFYAAPRLEGAPEHTPTAMRVTAILMLFALVNLQVSHGFAVDGELTFLSDRFTEEMTRSITWGAFGLVLLVAGVIARSRVVRVVAFLFLLLAAGKVFLVDLANLGGLARVGSFFGLSVFLAVAAILYLWLDRKLAGEAEQRPADEGR